MSTGDQRIEDAMRLTADAVLTGQVAALENVLLELARRQEANHLVLESGATATDKMKARGANEEIGALLAYVQQQIDAAQAARGN